MANRTATLVKNQRIGEKWRLCKVSLHKNGSVKAIVYDGKEIRPDNEAGEYKVRFYSGSRLCYEGCGKDPIEAVNSWRRKQILMAHPDIGLQTPPCRSETPTIAQLVKQFYQDKNVKKGDNYSLTLQEFVSCCSKSDPAQLTETDVVRFCERMLTRGLSKRTVSNRYGLLRTFLRHSCKIDPNQLIRKTVHKQYKKHEKRKPDMYSSEEIDRLLAACHRPYWALVFELLLKTGFRFREAMCLYWSDINLEEGTIWVRAKPELEFRPKNWEERGVPLEPGLAAKLKAWRKLHPGTRLVLGTANDRPNDKWLYGLKRIVKKASLGCGVCDTCIGKGECRRWTLHKFRRTYLSRCLQGGMDLATVQELAGHHDLKSTMRYLVAAESKSKQAQIAAIFGNSSRPAAEGCPEAFSGELGI